MAVDPQDARDAIESAVLWWLSQNQHVISDAVDAAVAAYLNDHPEAIKDGAARPCPRRTKKQ